MSLHATCGVFAAIPAQPGTWCSGSQSALDPAGPQSEQLAGLWWEFFDTSAIVYCLVIVIVVAALAFRMRRTLLPPEVHPAAFWENIRAWIVGGLTLATTVILFFLLIGDHVAGRAVRNPSTENAVKIRATG